MLRVRPRGAPRARSVPRLLARPTTARALQSLQPRGARPRPAPSREDLNSVENQSQKRTAVAFGLIFLLTAVYMTWFAPSQSPPHATAAVDAGTVASAPVAPAPVTASPPVAPSPGGAPPEGPAVRTLEVNRKLV